MVNREAVKVLDRPPGGQRPFLARFGRRTQVRIAAVANRSLSSRRSDVQGEPGTCRYQLSYAATGVGRILGSYDHLCPNPIDFAGSGLTLPASAVPARRIRRPHPPTPYSPFPCGTSCHVAWANAHLGSSSAASSSRPVSRAFTCTAPRDSRNSRSATRCRMVHSG